MNRHSLKVLAIAGTSAVMGLSLLPARSGSASAKPSPSESPSCEHVEPHRRGAETVLEIGRIWSGVRTTIAGAEPQRGRLLVAYYDADRQVTIASADAVSGTVCRVRLDNRFSGWDAHNSLALAVAPDGSLHVAGNAHASPLFYAWAPSGDLSKLRLAHMVGRDEDKATYPGFHKDAQGRQVFFYRSGGSGDGAWIADRWTGRQWIRLGTAFSATDRTGEHLSAYPTPFVTDGKGVSHVGIVWRRTPDVATNFAVGYARTSDFQTWSGIRGPSLKGPVRPDQIDVVEQPGQGTGLLNNARLLLAADGRPVLFYTRYGTGGTDALMAAYFADAKWTVHEIARSNHRTVIAGEGSLPGAPTFSVSSSRDIASISVAFAQGPRVSLRLDLHTLAMVKPQPAPARASTSSVPKAPASPVTPLLTIPAGLANASVWNQLVTATGYDGHSTSRLYWYAQGLNRDHAWTCTVRFPKACTPPASPLLWVIPSP